MTNETMDVLVKDRMVWITQFADALVWVIDTENAYEENDLIISKAHEGVLYEYIFEKYGDTPIFRNTLDISWKRYLNPLYRDGFEIAESREKYKHAKNNGLMNIIGVSLDIVSDWDSRISDVINELTVKKGVSE